MKSLEKYLVREDARLIMLLTPAFDRTEKDPGYIKGYLPGVRENGAQYTHAALWAVLAIALQGNGNRAFELYQMINPLTHARTPEEVEAYKVEPYVVAADVYTAEGQLGRGGWTWYTGSASWMYRVGLEGILGFTKRGDRLFIEPRAPTSWAGYTIEYRYGTSVYVIEVKNPTGLLSEGVEVTGVTRDSATLANGETIAAGRVVVAAGAWSGFAGVPVRPVKGQVVRMRGELPAERMIRTEHVYVVPRRSGEVVLGATVEERGFDTTVTAGAAHELLREGYRVLPEIAELELVDVSAGLRPGSPDNGPLLGEWEDGVLVATGHFRNGILLAPITAETVAALLAGESPPSESLPFTPERFARV